MWYLVDNIIINLACCTCLTMFVRKLLYTYSRKAQDMKYYQIQMRSVHLNFLLCRRHHLSIGTPAAFYFKKQNMKIALHVLFLIYCKSFYDLFYPAFVLPVFLIIIDSLFDNSNQLHLFYSTHIFSLFHPPSFH